MGHSHIRVLSSWLPWVVILTLWPASLEQPMPWGVRAPASTQLGDHRCQDFFQTICAELPPGGGEAFLDPTGGVLPEKKALRSTETLIQSHPRWIETIYSREKSRKIRLLERWVRRSLTRWIRDLGSGPLSLRDREELLRRLNTLHVQLPGARGYPDDPELLMQHAAFYESLQEAGVIRRRIRLGGAYVLGTSSRYNWIFTLAHEFAHAIDPCELRSSGWTPPALDQLNSCLVSAGIIQISPERRECLRQDQLSEAFADWVAVEILFRALQEFGREYPTPHRWAAVGNSVRDLCPPQDSYGPGDPGEDDSGWHPIAQNRINGILGQHPGIRKYLGCPPADQSTCRLGDQ